MLKIRKATFLLLLVTLFLSSCRKELDINDAGNLVPYTCDQDFSIPAITVNDIRLHSEAFGHPDSAMIVVLHGGPGSDYRSLLNCARFADYGYRVIFYDQGGAGLSQRLPKSHYSIQKILDELSGVIGHYKTHINQKVFLLGHSWGAILSAAYINQYPGNISGAVMAEPGGFNWSDIKEYVGKSRTIAFTNELLSDNTYIDQFLTGDEDEHQILDYKYVIRSAADGNKDNPIGNEGYLPFWRYGAMSNLALFELGETIKPDWTTNLNQFTTKVLFLYSQNNTAYGYNWATKVASPFTDVQFFEVRGAGHDLFSFQTGWNNCFPTMLNYFDSL